MAVITQTRAGVFPNGHKSRWKTQYWRLSANNKGENGHIDTIGETTRHAIICRCYIQLHEFEYLLSTKFLSILLRYFKNKMYARKSFTLNKAQIIMLIIH